MAYRCRSCGNLTPSKEPVFPSVQQLLGMVPFMSALLNAACEYDSFGEDHTTAAEFVRGLDFEVRRAAGFGRQEPAGRPGRKRPGIQAA